MIKSALTSHYKLSFYLPVATVFACVIILTGCTNDTSNAHRDAVDLIQRSGCGDCHSIPGIDWPEGHVGPSLYHFDKRAYIAGIAPNEPDNLVQFLMEPSSIHIHTAMPDLGLSQSQAAAIAQYLYNTQTD